LVVDTLDLSAAPLHPFVFVTSDKAWPGAAKRLITVIAKNVIYKSPPADVNAFFADLTLDKNYATFGSTESRLKAYSITVNSDDATKQFTSYLNKTMIWPLETAEKVSRQFATAPFDAKNQEFLKTKISQLYAELPEDSHPLARSIVAQTLQSINLHVDTNGLYPNYVPRLIFPKLVEDATRIQAEDLKNIEAWDQELIAAQKGEPLATTVGGIDAEVHSVDAELDAYQEQIDSDVTDLGRYEAEIVSLTGKVEQYRRDDRERMSEDEKHQRDAQGVLVGAKVVMVAASLIPVSAPVAIAIGTGVGIAGNQIAHFQEGEVPSLGGAVRDIPSVIKEAKEFNTLATNLKNSWTDVSAKYAAYHKEQSGTQATPPPTAPTKDAKSTAPDSKQALATSVGSFVTSLTDLVSHLNNPQPTQLSEDKYDQANKELQTALQKIGDIRQQEAKTSADLVALQQKLREREGRIGQLGNMRDDLSRLAVEDDASSAQRESLAWAVRQEQMRNIITQAVLLLRSYKYHTLQNPHTRITESYLNAQYNPSMPLESAPANADFFRNVGRANLQATLASQYTVLQTDLSTLVTNLNSDYEAFQNGFQKRQTGDPEYQSTCEPMQLPRANQPRDPNCEFVLAVNAEIARQWKYKGSPHPAAIPIPLKIKRTYRDSPRRLWDVSVRVEYVDKTSAKYGTIEFDVEHPMFGELWGAKDDDCTLVDMRKLDDVTTIQPYLSTCNGDTPCEHNQLELPAVLRAENESHAPLPLDTIYFLRPIVSGENLREPPQVKTIYVKLWFVE